MDENYLESARESYTGIGEKPRNFGFKGLALAVMGLAVVGSSGCAGGRISGQWPKYQKNKPNHFVLREEKSEHFVLREDSPEEGPERDNVRLGLKTYLMLKSAGFPETHPSVIAAKGAALSGH